MTAPLPFRLSVLDQSPIAEGTTAADAIRNTVDLARHVDRLGYDRYWLAEHHASPGLAGAAPEALIGAIALATDRIRVGSGGIMLPHYSPFKIAETFRVLGALAPGRIDLGVGRAAGSDQRTAFALQRDRSRRMPDDFAEHVRELLGYLADDLPASHPFASLARTLPDGAGGSPDPWMLGTSPDSARWAGEMGLPYCIADFINNQAVPLASIYRSAFRPSRWAAAPHVMVGVWTLAADSRAEAERLILPSRMMFSHLARGELIPIPSVEKAAAWAEGRYPSSGRSRRTVIGTAAEVRAGLEEVAALYGADELMLVNIMPDHEARKRSYTLVAHAFEAATAA